LYISVGAVTIESSRDQLQSTYYALNALAGIEELLSDQLLFVFGEVFGFSSRGYLI
jgi:hypothetical protein